jgi:hypothetical protein
MHRSGVEADEQDAEHVRRQLIPAGRACRRHHGWAHGQQPVADVIGHRAGRGMGRSFPADVGGIEVGAVAAPCGMAQVSAGGAFAVGDFADDLRPYPVGAPRRALSYPGR